MLFESPLTVTEVPVMPLWSKTIVEKETVVEICKRYEVALAEAFQLIVELIDIPSEPSGGEANNGGGGASTIVLKLQTVDQALGPT